MRPAVFAICLLASTSLLRAENAAIDALLGVGPEGKGNAQAATAWAALTKEADPATLMQLLEAMDRADPLAANWLRSAAEVIAGKLDAAGETALGPLGEFLLDQRHAPRARRFAFELIQKAEPASAEALVPGLLNDPSPELRRDAVARLMDQASALAKEGNKSGATLLYRQALGAAVEAAQVQPIADALKALEVEVDLPEHFGFLMRWHVAGPFDNAARDGFAKAYPPESGEVDLGAEYEAQPGKVKWQPLASSDPFGKIDLNKPFGMLKEKLGYAYTEFEAPAARAAEFRIGTKNAFKVWLNGELVFARDEYHRGQRIDQYQLPVQLKAGKNTILVKVCQNEQKEEWTVEWEFQLRVCDSTGTAILASNRLPTPQPEDPRARRRPNR